MQIQHNPQNQIERAENLPRSFIPGGAGVLLNMTIWRGQLFWVMNEQGCFVRFAGNIRLCIIIIPLSFVACAKSWGKFWEPNQLTNPCTAVPGPMSWARSQAGGLNINTFSAVAADCLGNIYAAGYVNNTQTYDLGAGVTVTGWSAGAWKTAILAKYDRSGNPVWVRRVTNSGTTESEFRGVAIDTAGNIYTAGTIYSNATFDFGNSVMVTTSTASINNAVIAKYDANGTALWAKSTSSFPNNVTYNAIDVDSAGNAYVAAQLANLAASLDFGNGVVTPSGISTTSSWVVAKYNSSGIAQWANIAVAPSTGDYDFPKGITVDNNGSVFSCGMINNTSTFNWTGASMSGGGTGQNAAIVKFSAQTGTAIAARSTQIAAPNTSNFFGCKTDPQGNVYAAGFQNFGAPFDWGSGISATGASSSGQNAVLIKYDNTLTPVWARTTSSGAAGNTQFSAVSIDSQFNVVVAGFQNGTASIGYGGGITATAIAGFSGNNALVLKYNSSGTALLSKIVTSGANASGHNGVAIADSDTIVAAGFVTNNGSYTFDPGLTATGANTTGLNLQIVKYP